MTQILRMLHFRQMYTRDKPLNGRGLQIVLLLSACLSDGQICYTMWNINLLPLDNDTFCSQALKMLLLFQFQPNVLLSGWQPSGWSFAIDITIAFSIISQCFNWLQSSIIVKGTENIKVLEQQVCLPEGLYRSFKINWIANYDAKKILLLLIEKPSRQSQTFIHC